MENEEMNDTRMRKVTQKETPDSAGAVTQDKRNYFSVGDTLLSHRGE
jgi:hypothetical protein